MKTFIKTIALVLFISLYASCEKETIPYYNSESNAVRFSDTIRFGYDIATSTLYKSHSFSEHMSDEYTTCDLPITLIGNVSDKDRLVAYTVDTENTSAPSGTYEVVEALIPANKRSGRIRVKIYNPDGEDTYELRLVIKGSEDLAAGPAEYLKGSLTWNNVIQPPTVANYLRSYNMLIKGTAAFTSTAATHYSSNALRFIVESFGWNDWDDKSAHPEYASYPTPTYFSYKYLPHWTLIYNDGTYVSFANKLGEYITAYNATHDEPLRHDAGAFKGQIIEARKY